MSSDYSARHLSVLEGLEAVRKRPGMYIGSTDSRGLMHCLWEIIDNSVDEALGGHGTEIDVVLHPDGSVEVRDRARGIPVDIEPKTGLSRRRGRLHQAARGRQVRLRLLRGIRRPARRRRLRRQRALRAPRRRGRPRRQDLGDVVPPRRAGHVRRRRRARRPTPPFTPFETRASCASSARSRRASPAPACATGPTRRSSRGAPTFQLDELLGRARQTAFLVPGLALDRHRRARRRRPNRDRFQFEGGISEFVEHLATDAAAHRHLAAHGRRALHRDGARAATTNGAHGADRARAGLRRRHRAALGHRLRHRAPQLRQHHRDAEGRHAPGRLRAGAAQVPARSRSSRTPAGSRSATTSSRRTTCSPGSPRCSRCACPSRSSRARPRRCSAPRPCATSSPTVVAKAMAERFASHQARRQGADRAAARQDRRRDEVAHLRARAQGDAAPQERAGELVAAGQARRLPLQRRRAAASCSSSRATPPSARRSSRATASTRRCCRSAARSSTCRRRRVSDMLSNAECASIIQVIGAGSGRSFDLERGALRQGHHHERRRRRRRAHPHPAAHPVLPLHAADDRGGPGLRRRAAAAPRGRDEPGLEAERHDLHLLGGGAAGRARRR